MKNRPRQMAAIGALSMLLYGPGVLAREFPADLVIESIEDIYALEQTGDLDGEDVDLLVGLMENPIDLNQADRSHLYELPAITLELADAIVDHRRAEGPFSEKDDLLDVPGMNLDILASLAPFVVVGSVDKTDSGVRGKVRTGSLWRQGVSIGRDPTRIDADRERLAGPQSHLRVEGRSGDRTGAGLLLTHRRQTLAHWDFDRGQLVSDGPADRLAVDGAYFHFGWDHFRVIAGTYNVGFGERLTFDSTRLRYPDGWSPFGVVRENNQSGRITPQQHLTGLAATVCDLRLGGVGFDATAFVSHQSRDLYQYDLWYGPDAWTGANQCHTDGDCPPGYTCAKGPGLCRSSQIYSRTDESVAFRYETLSRAFRETLMGGNLRVSLPSGAQVGVTGYHAHHQFTVAVPAHPGFREGARWPQANAHGAVGIFGRHEVGDLTLTGEYAFAGAHRKGHAALVRVVFAPVVWAEFVGVLRYYDPNHENPYGRGEAAPALSDGLRQRNERGLRLQAMLTPDVRLRLVTDVDLYRRPHQGEYIDGAKHWVPGPGPWLASTHLRLRQQAIWGVTKWEDGLLQIAYANKDLYNNGRDESYELGDFQGRGEKRTVQVGVRTSRIPRTRLTANYAWTWTDVGRFADRFERQERLRIRASGKAWPGARLALGFSHWRRGTGLTEAQTSDRQAPTVDGYLEYGQRLPRNFVLRLRYGLLHYRDLRPERYTWYQIAKLSVETAF